MQRGRGRGGGEGFVLSRCVFLHVVRVSVFCFSARVVIIPPFFLSGNPGQKLGMRHVEASSEDNVGFAC